MAKLNKLQTKKYETIKKYLAQMDVYNYLLIDSESTNVYSITNIYINATGCYIAGSDVHCSRKIEVLHPTEITEVYRQCMKDEDFKEFVNSKNK